MNKTKKNLKNIQESRIIYLIIKKRQKHTMKKNKEKLKEYKPYRSRNFSEKEAKKEIRTRALLESR